MFAALLLGAVLDAAIAVLLLFVSGYIFGDGPEGANGEMTAVVLWSLAMLLTISAPVSGFLLRTRGQAGWGVAAAFVPPLVAAFFIGV